MEQRFELTKPLLGRKRGSVTVGSAVRIAHPLLKQPIDVPLHQIAAVMRVEQAANEEIPLLVRDARVLPIVTMATSTPNVVIVLRSPMTVHGFKLGSDRFFPITGRQRRRGLDIDLFTVGVVDPEGLIAAMTAAGVNASTPLADVLRAVIGEATGPQVADRQEAIRRSTGRASFMLLAVGLGLAALLAARGIVGSGEGSVPTDTLLRTTAAAMAAAIGLGALLALMPRRRRSEGAARSDNRAAVSYTVSGIAMLAVGIGALFLTRDWTGPAYVLSRALVGGAVGAYLISKGFVTYSARRALPEDQPGPPSSESKAPRTSSTERGVLVIVMTVFLIAAVVLASGEPDHGADLALAKAAVITVEDLPPGWKQCCGEATYRGSELAEHICGSQPLGLPAHTAGFDREFTRDLQADGSESGHLVMAVFLAATEERAVLELAATDLPGYQDCARASVGRTARISVPSAVGDPIVTVTREVAPSVDSGNVVVDRFVSTFQTDIGMNRVVLTTFIRMQVGRAIVRMPVQVYGAEMSEAEVEALVRLAYSRVSDGLAADALTTTVDLG